MNILYNILQCAVVTFFLSIPETRAVAGEAMIFISDVHLLILFNKCLSFYFVFIPSSDQSQPYLNLSLALLSSSLLIIILKVTPE